MSQAKPLYKQNGTGGLRELFRELWNTPVTLPDWKKPHLENVKVGVRSAVKTVLRKRGVKPDHLESLTKQVIIQAEAMFKDWPLAA